MAEYVTSYELARDFNVRADFSLKNTPGLLRCELTRSANASRLDLSWATKVDADKEEPNLASYLGVCVPPTNLSAVAYEESRGRGFVPQFGDISKWIVALAALFGALTVIRDYFADLFLPPDVHIALRAGTPRDYPFGGHISLPLVVRNQGRLGLPSLDLTGAKIAKDGKTLMTLTFDPGTVPLLESGKPATDVSISGEVPVPTQSGPNTYVLQITSDAKLGLFWPKRHPTYMTELKLWPEQSTEGKFIKTSDSSAQLTITASSSRGRKDGVSGFVSFTSAASPKRSEILSDSGGSLVGESIIDRVNGGFHTKTKFKTNSFSPYTEAKQNIVWEFQRTMNEMEWQSTRTSMEVEFQ